VFHHLRSILCHKVQTNNIIENKHSKSLHRGHFLAKIPAIYGIDVQVKGRVLFIELCMNELIMAKAKTGPFYITKSLVFPVGAPAGTIASDTISIESFIDIPNRQGLEILEVDFVMQGYDDALEVYYAPNVVDLYLGDGSLGFQLLDQEATALVRADDRTLVASGSLAWDFSATVGGLFSESNDFFPDIYNKNTDGRVVINDQLHLVSRLTNSDLAANQQQIITCRIKARVVTLTTTDFVSLSLTAVATDN
jgi:hypothetical protein